MKSTFPRTFFAASLSLVLSVSAEAESFAWRGFHFDEARHFFGKETVKDYLEHMHRLGLNRFHWHLADDQKRLATPFAQIGPGSSRRGGTGLGLHICRLFARAMGGDMLIDSVPGEGATFSIVVPGVAVAKPEDFTRESETAPPSAHGTRILVADDTKLNQLVLKTMLSRIGVGEAVFVSTGREALEILESRGAGAFDLVLTDMWMPEMTGVELVAAIRANPALAKTPVYLFTAEVEMKQSYAEKGFDGILLKPASIEALRKLLP